MRKTLVFILMVLLAKNNAQQLQWAFDVGASGGNAAGIAITHDNSGNVIASGIFDSGTDFDPGSGTYAITPISGISTFLAKYSATGIIQWALPFPGKAGIVQIRCDAANNIILAGNLSGSVDMDPGPGTDSLYAHSGFDIFLAKYDSAGNYLWAINCGAANGAVEVSSLAVDFNNQIVISGDFVRTIDFDPGAGTYNITSPDTTWTDDFVAKFASTGTLLWAINFNLTQQSSNPLKVSAEPDQNGNIFVTGAFLGTGDFDPGPSVHNLSANGKDLFVAHYSPGGALTWAFKLGGAGNADNSVSLVTYHNDVIICGGFADSLDVDPSNAVHNLYDTSGGSAFFSRYDANGNYQWAFSLGQSPGFGYYPMEIDPFGNFTLMGSMYSSPDFDPGPGVYTLSPISNQDNFFANYSNSGTFNWAFNLGNSTAQLSPMGITGSPGSDFFVTGFLSGVNYNMAPRPDTLLLSTASGNGTYVDFVVARYGSVPNAISDHSKSSGFTVFPSPASTKIYLQLNGIHNIKNVLITNALGIPVLNTEDQNIDITSLTDGIYFAFVKTENELLNQKFIVNK